jgi:hypothetical protein
MVQQIYGQELRSTSIFAVDGGDGKGQERWETLSKRVTEHVPSSTIILILEYSCCSQILHSDQNGSFKHFP